MDLLVERICSRSPSSFVHGPIPRKAVLGATFAKSKKPASLFQGYHQKTKHVGSDFCLILNRGGQNMEKRCLGPEANANGDNTYQAFRKLDNGAPRENLEAIVSSELCLSSLDLMRLLVGTYAQQFSSPAPDWILRALSDLPSEYPKHVLMKPSSIPVIPSQPCLSQTPNMEAEESVFAFAPPSLSPPSTKLANFVTSTPQATHASLPTLTSARSYSKCSRLSTLTTCDIPIISNRLSTSVSPPSSPFPMSPRAPLLSSFNAKAGQTPTPRPKSPQLREYTLSSRPSRCPQAVDIVNDPSDPDPVGRIWRQERDIAQKGRNTIPSRVYKLSLLQPFKPTPTIVAQTEAPLDSFIDAGPVVPKNTEQIWVPSFPDAKTPNHRLADPGRSQLRRRTFLGSADPIITPQVIATETSSVKGDLPDVGVCPITASKVKFWIPDIHSSPFSVARSLVAVPPADIHSEVAGCPTQNVVPLGKLGLGETLGRQRSSSLDYTHEVADYCMQTDPEPSGGPQVS